MKILRKFKFWFAGGGTSLLFFGLFLTAVSNSSTGAPHSGIEEIGPPIGQFFTLFLLGLITGGGGTALWIKFDGKQKRSEPDPESHPEGEDENPPFAQQGHRPPWRFPWE